MKEKGVAFVISHMVGLGTAIPYVRALEAEGRTVRVYCLGDFQEIASELLPGTEVVPLGVLRLPRRLSRVVAKLQYGLSSFDPGLNSTSRQQFEHRSSLGSRARKSVLSATRRFKAKTINRISRRVFATFLKIPSISEREIWVVSFLLEPLIAITKGARVCTLMDSWDHPVRRVAGYETDVVIGWNRPLAEDWIEYQGGQHAVVGAPLRLQYAAEAYPLAPCANQTLMYAVGTSSHSGPWETGELRLAELVCDAASDAGWEVVLKLKPTGGQDAWRALGARYAHVSFTEEREALGPMHFYLDPTYNAGRLEALRNVACVVNAVTTFGLDAACAGVPVLQLAGLRGPGLAGIAAAQKNYHLQRYLLSDPDLVFEVEEAQLRCDLAAWLADPDQRAVKYAATLRGWIVGDDDIDLAVRHATSRAMSLLA